MHYICELVNNNENKNNIIINKLEINIADDINTEIGPEPVFKNECLYSNYIIFILLSLFFGFVFLSNTTFLVNSNSVNSTIIKIINFIFAILCVVNVVIAFIMDEKIAEIDEKKNIYYTNKLKIDLLNELTNFLSNKDKYSDITYNTNTKVITYFDENDLLKYFYAIQQEMRNYNDTHTEYWKRDYIKIDINNNKIIEYYPFKLKK